MNHQWDGEGQKMKVEYVEEVHRQNGAACDAELLSHPANPCNAINPQKTMYPCDAMTQQGERASKTMNECNAWTMVECNETTTRVMLGKEEDDPCTPVPPRLS
jgi:hypothetical protein